MEPLVGWPSLGEAKKRDYRALSAALPSRKAWQDEWTKPGAEGGMGRWVLESWSERRAQTRDLRKRSELKAEVVGEARKDVEELVSSFCMVKKRRASPAGSPPAEICTMLLHASRNLSPRGQGVGYQRKKIGCMDTPQEGGESRRSPTRQVTTWRLERLGLKSLTAFHDLTEAMDRAAAGLLGPNCLLGQHRYRLATTTIRGKDGDVTLKIEVG